MRRIEPPMNADKINPKSISHRDHRERRMGVSGAILRLKITLMDCKPTIWREIEVVLSMTLSGLHEALQVLMGWEDGHLWAFEAGQRRFEPPDPDGMNLSGRSPEDPERVTLRDLFAKEGQNILYQYDFGDDWRVEIAVVAIGKPAPGVRYPRCLGGERAGPPEDCGGPPGFEELLAARRKPKSALARELLEWVGPDWDPNEFDIVAVNKDLAALRAPRHLH
jgi:hypothetical protein